WLVPLAAAASLGGGTGCASVPACPETGCGPAKLCEAHGQCVASEILRPLARGHGQWLEPMDWTYTRAGHAAERAPDGAVLELGGPEAAVVFLALGPIPRGARIARATLHLRLHGRSGDLRDAEALIAHRTSAFVGSRT